MEDKKSDALNEVRNYRKMVLIYEALDEQIDKSMSAFSQVPGVTPELAEDLVVQGFFTFDDLSVIEPDQLAELGGLTAEQCEAIVEYADIEAAREEERERLEAREAARLKREQAELEAMTPPSARTPAVETPAEEQERDEAEDEEEAAAEAADTHTLEAAEDAHEEIEAETEAAEVEAENEQLGDDSAPEEMPMGEPVANTPELSGLEGDANAEPEENGTPGLEQKNSPGAVRAGVGSEESAKAEEA